MEGFSTGLLLLAFLPLGKQADIQNRFYFNPDNIDSVVIYVPPMNVFHERDFQTVKEFIKRELLEYAVVDSQHIRRLVNEINYNLTPIKPTYININFLVDFWHKDTLTIQVAIDDLGSRSQLFVNGQMFKTGRHLMYNIESMLPKDYYVEKPERRYHPFGLLR